MEFDNGWRAVFDPGAASRYFSPPPPRPLTPSSRFDVVNAWWLAELSRLIYRDDPSDGERTRDRILAAVGLTESRFFSRDSTEGALVQPRGEVESPVAALIFRGTDGPEDWNTNVRLALTSWPQGGTVHAGFRSALDNVWPEVEAALDELATPVFYAGHSLGGALAMLAAGRRPPLAVYTFGGPRVGDAEFAETLADLAVYRVVNRKDTVPTTPPNLPGMRYSHAGELRGITAGQPRELARRGKGGRLRAQFPPQPGQRRWHHPPPNVSDHAPVNYVACLERVAGGRK